MPPDEAILVADGISRRFGYRYVLRDVNLALHPGDAVMIVGPNGAGKTTLLRVLAGLLHPSTGAVRRRGTLGLVAHHSMLYDALTARENLRFFARLHGAAARARVEAVLQQVGLEARADDRVGAFSRGMTQRLAIARALLSEPQILLLDEPLTGLDDTSAAALLEVLGVLRGRGCALLIASHQLAELLGLVATIAFLGRGTLLALEPVGRRDAAAIRARQRILATGG